MQPHVVHCNVRKAVDGIHVARNLIRGLAYRDQISIMAGSEEKIFSCPFTHGQDNMIVIPLKFLIKQELPLSLRPQHKEWKQGSGNGVRT